MPTLHHTFDRGGSYVRARVFAPANAENGVEQPVRPAAIAASREARFLLTPSGIDRLREHGCYDEGDYVPPEILSQLVREGNAYTDRQKPGTQPPKPPRLFPEPSPPGWMLPRRRTILGL